MTDALRRCLDAALLLFVASNLFHLYCAVGRLCNSLRAAKHFDADAVFAVIAEHTHGL